MATATAHASAFTNTTGFDGNFTAPTNAYSSNDQYAESTVDANPRNDEYATCWSGFDFSSIPDGSTINSVVVHMEYHVDTQWSAGTIRLSVWADSTTGQALALGDTGNLALWEQAASTAPTSDTDWQNTMGANPTLAQLKASGFGVRVEHWQGNDATARATSIDDLYIVVDYTAGATTQTGSFTADATILSGRTGSFTADAVIFATGAGSFTLDAILGETFGGTFTLDALPLATIAGAATADADIFAVVSGASSLDAVVQVAAGGSFGADAILLVPRSAAVQADAVVERTPEAAFSTDAILLHLGQAGALTADAWIQLDGGVVSDAFAADAVVSKEQAGSFDADALVLAVSTGAFTGDATFFSVIGGTFTIDALIPGGAEGSATIDAVIGYVGRAVWVSPANTIGMNATPTLVFLMPEASGNMHFQIELDTDSGFSAPTVVQSPGAGWEYWDGGGWQPIPSGGVPNTYSGNEARYTVQSPLSQATWYRRVRAGVIS